jgi:NADP-dependent 3-hydroxy acid dehydrogenase YdfG
LLARGEEGLRGLAAEIGDGAVVLAADVTSTEEVERAVERFEEQAGAPNLVVANAGIANYAPFADQELEDAERMVQVNVLGMLYTVKAALPRMMDRAEGHVVIVSSGAADRAFAEALRHELSGTGVSVTTVFPGEVETDLHSHERDVLPDWRENERELPAAKVADAIVGAVERDERNVYLPGIVRLLGLNGLAPRLTDRVLAAIRGYTAAPRRD